MSVNKNNQKHSKIEYYVDLIIEKIEDDRNSFMNEDELEIYDEILLNKLKNLSLNKKDELDEEKITSLFLSFNQEGDDVENIFHYIYNTYKPEAYANKQFVIQIPTEYGLIIESYKISNKSKEYCVLDGVSTFINPKVTRSIPFILSSYIFYKNNQPIKNYLQEEINAGITSYYINGKRVINDNVDTAAEDETVYNILQQINDKFHLYPWLEELVNSKEKDYKLLIIEREKVDKIKLSF